MILPNTPCLVRIIEMARISAYVIEKFRNKMIQLYQIQGIERFWLHPISYHIDDKLRVSLFYPESVSLYELLHSDGDSNLRKILQTESNHTRNRIKYEIAFQLAKILLTIHSLDSIHQHGHLSSHNVFVTISKVESGTFEIKVKISDIETMDFMEYGNMFFNYRIASVWSSPEILSNIKKLPKLTP